MEINSGLQTTDSLSVNRRTYLRVSLIATFSAAIFFIGILLLSGANFLSKSFTTSFYGEQAQAFLKLRWDVPFDVLGHEGFLHNGQWFMYFGPFPALLRLPLEFLQPGLSRGFTQISMLGAWAIAMWATADLCWRIRCLVRDAGSVVTTLERWAVGGFLFSVGAGSALSFLASQAWVYHEAELWGTALTIASFDLILAYLMNPRRRLLVFVSILATFAICSRASVGLGPVVALGLLAVASLTPRTQRVFGLAKGNRSKWLTAGALAVACTIPLLIYFYTNWSKFGTLFVFPTGQQLMSTINPRRRDFLAKSGGSYFGIQFIPTTLWAYLRPNGIGLTSLFPWVTFPGTPAVFGGSTFDAIEPTSSLPASMPFLSVLAITGLIGTWARSRGRVHLEKLRAPLLGATVSALAVLPFGFIAERYKADFFPFLVLAGVTGLHLILRWSAETTNSKRRVLWGWRVLGFALFLSVFINTALAIDYHWKTPWAREDQVAPLIEAQYRLHAAIPGGSAPYVVRRKHLPWPPLSRGTTVMVGDCEGLYWSQGSVPALGWSPYMGLARTRSTGEYNLNVRFTHSSNGAIEPIVVRGEPGRLQSLVVIVSSNKAQFGFISEGHEDLPHGPRGVGGMYSSPAVRINPSIRYRLKVVMDSENGKVAAYLNDQLVFNFYQIELTPHQNNDYVFPTSKVSLGMNPGKGIIVPKFSGEIEEVVTEGSELCDLVRKKAQG